MDLDTYDAATCHDVGGQYDVGGECTLYCEVAVDGHCYFKPGPVPGCDIANAACYWYALSSSQYVYICPRLP
jgi:hypothetical protein